MSPRRRIVLTWLLLSLTVARGLAASLEEVSRWVNAGQWQQAQREIAQALARPELGFAERDALLFQRERMARMRLDFDQTRAQVLHDAQELAPTLTEAQFARWEQNGVAENMVIDGERWFFHRAAGNLFRISPEAGALKPNAAANAAMVQRFRREEARRVLAEYDRTGERLVTPKTARVTYTLRVKAGAVPAGEIIRAWLPLPHESGRQKNLQQLTSDPARSVRPDPASALQSIYLEKPAVAGGPTEFKISYVYTSSGFYQRIDPAKVQPVRTDDPALAPYLMEQPPHLAFSPELKQLARDIVGAETNPYLKARLIFQWVSKNIPWAGAREYSTLECLPQYALANRHGDCGIQTMLFMVLCRINGIPSRWESGWTTGWDQNMHDWCQIFLAPYGWMPVDASHGLITSEDEREKWFYLGGVDSHRLVVNTDYSQPVYPAKVHFRSEIIDFQRGEVEWRGGNLYFDQWKWNFDVEEISPNSTPRATKPAVTK